MSVAGLFDDTRFVGAILILLVAISGAFWAILVKYLQEKGMHSVQVFLLSQFCTFLYSSVMHLVLSTRDWYKDMQHSKTQTSTLTQGSTQTLVKKTISDPVSVSISEVDLDSEFGYGNLKTYLLSIFPSIDSLGFKVALFRGLLFGISTQLCMIGFIFLDSGDAMLLRTIISSLIMLIVGIIYFDEMLTKWLILAFIIALIGLTLTIQPAFLFDSSIDEQISVIGLIVIFISAIFRAFDKIVIKYTGKEGVTVHWFALLMISYGVTTVFGIMEIICLIMYYYIIDNGDIKWNDNIWYEWNENKNCTEITTVFMLFSFIAVFEMCCQMYAYQVGDIGKLGILVSSEIAFTYMLEAIFLDVTKNYLVYIGLALVMMYSGIVFVEQAKQAKETMNENVNNDDQEYQPIDDKQEESMSSIQLRDS